MFLLISVAGCGPIAETPQSIAAKSMLTTREAVIGMAVTADNMCRQKIIAEAECLQAKKAYEQFQVCYGVASDTFLLYVRNGAGDYNALAIQVLACKEAFGGGK
jgi:hypothetical protein